MANVMLMDRYAKELCGLITLYQNYHPFPQINNREKWETLPDSVREDWIFKGQAYLEFPWPTLTAVEYMEFMRNGNVIKFLNKYEERRRVLATLVLAECMEGTGRFIDQIINGIWCICEESSWVPPQHMVISTISSSDILPNISDQFIDLCAGETASLLAITQYLLQIPLDEVSGGTCRRIRTELQRRVIDPYLERSDLWWMGLQTDRKMNNWNPWINSNCLSVFLLSDDEGLREQGVSKVMLSLDRFISDCHKDGGCDEGPVYWERAGGSLFDCLELLYGASNGKINLYDEPLIKEIGRYLYRAHIDDTYFVNFADSSAKFNIEPDLAYRFGYRVRDPLLVRLACSTNPKSKQSLTGWLTLHRLIPSFFVEERLAASKDTPPYVRDVWLDEIQFMAAREREGSSEGLYLAVKGGHNDESHNHNDIGNFIVYLDGAPFLIDVGVETYTAKTFSPQRYDIWTMQSSYHNVPMVNGFQQQAGRDFKAGYVNYQVENKTSYLSINIASAYPSAAEIVSWNRTYRLNRTNESMIQIEDNFILSQASDDIELNLMTPWHPQIEIQGTIILRNAQGKQIHIDYDESKLAAYSEQIELTDEKLQGVWGDYLFRITLKSKVLTTASSWTMNIRK
jgi:hypothetical protein